jgi:uncharacterized protein (DUF433 family)
VYSPFSTLVSPLKGISISLQTVVVMMTKKIKELSLQETMERYPRITAHIIAESLGYATPSCAARILKDAREGKKNYCEWIYS